jgi:hypothetical protein
VIIFITQKNEKSTSEEKYTNPDESGLRSGKGPSFLSKLFGKY